MKRNPLVMILSLMALLVSGTLLWARDQAPPVLVQAQQQQTQQTQLLNAEQLNNLVAPIALYPDPLLGQMLVAATYPLELVEASQWLARNTNLSSRELIDAAKQQPWDPSVQALVAVPDALTKLNQDISWTTDLGNAFLAQETDLMSAIQQMRARAQESGKLASTPQQTVTSEAQGGQQVIVIQPANPQVIYVPYYDPLYVWGPPAYGYYPPLYYSGFGFGFGRGLNLSFCFGGWGGWGGWGWGPDWFGHSVFINSSFFPRFGYRYGYPNGFAGRTIWTHNPVHRLGIPYANRMIAERFRGPLTTSRDSLRVGAESRYAAAPRANGSVPAIREPGSRYAAPQGSPSRTQQRYQVPQQPRTTPQERYRDPQQFRLAPQQRYQAPQQSRPAPQQRYEAPQQSRPAPQQRYQAPQQFRPAPQMRNQAPQQLRSAPRMSAPRSGGGGSARSGGGRRR